LAIVEEYRAPDDHTVIIKLKRKFAPFIYALDIPIMPRHLYDGKDYRSNPANQMPVGTGPFKFKEWRRGEYIHLVRNENYFKPGLPYLDEIYFRVILDASTRVIALESGEVHLASFTDIEPIFIPQLSKNPALEVTHKGYEFLAPLSWLEINNRAKPLDDRRLRQAIMHAIDREFLRDKIWFGQAKVATSPISSVTNFYDPTVPKYDYNPRKAEALLDEMGLKRGASGIRAKFKFLQFPYGQTWTKASEVVKQQLGRIGLEIELEATDAGGWAQRVSNWDFELTFNYVLQFADPALGVSRSYVTSNIQKGVPFSNTSGYSNATVDALCDQAAGSLDPEERRRLYAEVQRRIIEDVPVAWLLELQFPTVMNKKFRDIVTTGFGTFSSLDVAYVT
jgi:peptide/nickel transport system substrate-binding protein